VSEQQSSQLLPGLFTAIEEDQRFTVLHIGPAQPETVAFFSAFRCRLYINDLFAELPLVFAEGDEQTLQQRVGELLSYPADVAFDLCLFWDIFNYLDADAVRAVMLALQPHLTASTLGHCFGVHNARSPQRDRKYSLLSPGELKLRPRPCALPGYAPHPQGRLKELLGGFAVQRSVLLADSRLELLLAAKT
jgi:hypothetical protein